MKKILNVCPSFAFVYYFWKMSSLILQIKYEVLNAFEEML